MASTNKERLLYKGKIKAEFNDANHAYTINGERVKISATGVTGMMNKPALMFWSVKMMKEYLMNWINNGDYKNKDSLTIAIDDASKAHTRKKEEAASVGSLVHEWAENYILWKLKRLKNKPEIDPKADERVNNGVLAFLRWVDQHKIKFIDSETLLYSMKHGYCGIADCIAEVDGKMTLVDFKTSNYLAIEYYAQVAGYAYADNEESKRKYDQSMIIKFGKDDGEFELKIRDKKEMAEDFEAFLGLLAVKKWSDKNSTPWSPKK